MTNSIPTPKQAVSWLTCPPSFKLLWNWRESIAAAWLTCLSASPRQLRVEGQISWSFSAAIFPIYAHFFLKLSFKRHRRVRLS